MRVYADNAATTAMSQVAIDAMLPYFNKVYGNPSSLHSVGQEAKEALEAARATVAACLGCEPREIYFTSGGSEADNQAIISAARFGARKGKKHIITTAFEHHAVLHTVARLEKEGFEVTYLDVSNGHNITAQQVKDAIRPDTCLVTTMYANNEIGSVLPIAEIGAVCKEKGVLFHTDAVQAAGHIHIDVEVAHSLNGIGVEQNAGLLTDSADFRNGQHRTDLIVGVHHGDQAGIGADGILDLLSGDVMTLAYIQVGDFKAFLLQPGQGVTNGMVLKGGGDDVLLALALADAGSGNQSLVVGLAAAGGEEDLPGLAAQALSHGGTGSVQSFLGGLANGVQRRGIAVNFVEVRQHGINGHLAHSGGCRVICVNIHSVYLHMVFT